MNTTSLQKNTSIHIGRNVRRLREIKSIKQESLALTLAISQQKISKLEQSERIDEETLCKIADALGISVESIKNFDETAIINNSCVSHTMANANFDAMEKIIELYERLIESEKDKNALLSLSCNLKAAQEDSTISNYLNKHTGTLSKRND